MTGSYKGNHQVVYSSTTTASLLVSAHGFFVVPRYGSPGFDHRRRSRFIACTCIPQAELLGHAALHSRRRLPTCQQLRPGSSEDDMVVKLFLHSLLFFSQRAILVAVV